ncbi:T6SS immunity protein Tdi1 domain-containing protein [uncultured Erythrobacter sp.]|uniref:T6SS immunity protein Tdi1 domain-containing protein n=1 Tax=uncultured Erythrobacter sp. TaxID=263913 RepID=UPI00262ECDD8|nr:T6SS immunity protein Tdi1 domain-containing protein [uncultured Erythrobacter sp.]
MGWKNWFGGKSDSEEDEQELDLAIDLVAIGGSPENAHLFIEVPEEDILRALDGWRWLPLSGLTAIAVSAFGEVFFRDVVGVIHQIDTIDGKLSKAANSLAELTVRLQEVEARDSMLFEALVIGARNRGLILESGECYDFRIAPVFGGTMNVAEMHKLSFVVKLHIAGQLHEQVRGLPPGTPISEITISD